MARVPIKMKEIYYEPLISTEKKILQLMAQGMSYQERGERSDLTCRYHNSYGQGKNMESKGRSFTLCISGILLIIAAVWIWIAGDWKTFPVVVGTEVLILGIALLIMSSPDGYNAYMNTGAILSFERACTIEEFHEAYKNIGTPLGSAWLGMLSGRSSMIFGPDKTGLFIYLRLSEDGTSGYIGSSPVREIIGTHVTEPLLAYTGEAGDSPDGENTGQTDVSLFQNWLKESLEQYVKSGEVIPFWEL